MTRTAVLRGRSEKVVQDIRRSVTPIVLRSIFQEPFQAFTQLLCIASLALPDDEYVPTALGQRMHLPEVTCDILLELLRPILDSGLWCRCRFASLVPVPETPMDENDLPL